MIIERNTEQPAGIFPEVLDLLSCDFDTQLFHSSHKLRHPLGIYNSSLSRVLDNFIEVLDQLVPLIREVKFLSLNTHLLKERLANLGQLENQLLNCQSNLLYALMEHMDDCENILKTFYPSSEKISTSKLLFGSGPSKNYRTHIGKVVNHLKHNQGRLRSIVFFNDTDVFPGYFVEDVDANGALGPAFHIHNGGNTAFSFARDLRYHLFGIYVISQKLTKSITNIVGNGWAIDKKVGKDDTKLIEIFRRISSFSYVFFPDEVSLPVPSAKITQLQTGEMEIMVSYPATETEVVPLPNKTKVLASHRGDGVTKSFRQPYRY